MMDANERQARLTKAVGQTIESVSMQAVEGRYAVILHLSDKTWLMISSTDILDIHNIYDVHPGVPRL